MVSQDGAVQEPKTAPLSRSGSLYNLTLDEVQNQLASLGKPLGSMNLDELLKSVWSVEAGEASGLDFGSDDTNMQHNQHASGGYSLNSQGSINLSGDLSKKTVDEVWRDMQLKKTVDQERQPTLGEMTLEDFLLKAGVVGESIHTKDSSLQGVDSNGDSQQNVSQHGHWMQYQLPSMQQSPHQHENHQNNMMGGFVTVRAIQPSFQVPGNPVMDGAMSPSSLMGTLSDTQTLSRKRFASGHVVEKSVERRQKRMIKNRESAARSRARKQAYTQELELKISRLEEENERLRRQNEIEKVLPSAPDLDLVHSARKPTALNPGPSAPPPEPRNQLRKTSSATL